MEKKSGNGEAAGVVPAHPVLESKEHLTKMLGRLTSWCSDDACTCTVCFLELLSRTAYAVACKVVLRN